MKLRTRLLLLVLAVAGLGLSLLLAYKAYHLESNLLIGGCQIANTNFDCNAVAQSSHSKLFGIPNGIIGVAVYVMLLAYFSLASFARKSGEAQFLKPATGLAWAGLAYSIYLITVMVGIGKYCLFCLALDFINLAMVSLLAFIWLPWLRVVLAGVFRFVARQGWVWRHFVVFLMAIGVALCARYLLQKGSNPEQSVPSYFFVEVKAVGDDLDEEKQIIRKEQYLEAQSQLELQVKKAAGDEKRLATANANMKTLAETCIPIELAARPREGFVRVQLEMVLLDDLSKGNPFYSVMKALSHRYGEQFEVFHKIKFSPAAGAALDKGDVKSINEQCLVPLAAMAAFRQGKFKEFRDQLELSSVPVDQAAAVTIAKLAGLRVDRFQKDLSNPELILTLRQDWEDQKKIGGDTSVLVNGSKYKGPPELSRLTGAAQYALLGTLFDTEQVSLEGSSLIHTGSGKIPVKVVIYDDLNCEYCRAFHPELKKLLAHYQSQLAVEVRQFPSDTKCNPYVVQGRHPNACYAARALIAAGQQGKGWQQFEAIMEQPEQHTSEDLLTDLADKLHLDMSQYKADYANPATLDIIHHDLEKGVAIGISSTPEIYLNGYRYKGIRSVEMLVMAIDYLISRPDHHPAAEQ